MSSVKIHPEFRLNGKKFSSSGTVLSYVKKYFSSHYLFLQDLFNTNEYIKVYTSGSTGLPKEIQIKKLFMLNSARQTIDFFGLDPGTRALLNLSPDYIAGKMMWVRALTGGWQLDVISPENKIINKQLLNNTYDFGAMVPVQANYNRQLLHKINQLIIGGGAVSPSLFDFISSASNKIFATYGMTETVTHIAVKPLSNGAYEQFYNQDLQKDSYRVFDSITISKDDRGCLVIEAPHLSNERVVTNDLVQILDKRHFKWLGRYDNIINSGGIKFIPEQIEEKIKDLLPNAFFIAGLPDENLGQQIVMLVEGRVDKFLLQKAFDKVLNKFERPKKIIEIDRFLRAGNGKIRRRQILNGLRE